MNHLKPGTKERAPSWIKEEPDGCLLYIRVQPRARQNEILDVKEGRLRIRITAPPVDSAANEAVVKFLAETLGVSKSRVRLIKGKTSREKAIFVAQITLKAIACIFPSAAKPQSKL